MFSEGFVKFLRSFCDGLATDCHFTFQRDLIRNVGTSCNLRIIAIEGWNRLAQVYDHGNGDVDVRYGDGGNHSEQFARFSSVSRGQHSHRHDASAVESRT